MPVRHVYEWAGHCALKNNDTYVYLFYFILPYDYGEWILDLQFWARFFSLVLQDCVMVLIAISISCTTDEKVIKDQEINSG